MKTYRILIADDEPIERMVIARTVRKHFSERLEILEAENGREAVEMAKEHCCEIYLMDIEMPGMNGLDAAEKIRELYPECSIIFVTAFDEFTYAKKAISVRALEYLLKPTVETELIAAVEEAIHSMEKYVGAGLSAEESGEILVAEDGGARNEVPETEGTRLRTVEMEIRDYIEKHYHEDISLQSVARYMRYSDPHMSRLFKQCFDRSFTVYLTEFRLERAKELLGKPEMNIRDISSEVGFRDSNYFARIFKREVGCTPSEFRHSLEQGDAATQA